MKYIRVLIISLILLFCLAGCTDSVAETEERFKQAYCDYSWEVIYDTKTKVMYLHDNVYKDGGLTVLVDSEGKPLLYEGE
jgi:hypothetical protein